jgi:hypothetical protein
MLPANVSHFLQESEGQVYDSGMARLVGILAGISDRVTLRATPLLFHDSFALPSAEGNQALVL